MIYDHFPVNEHLLCRELVIHLYPVIPVLKWKPLDELVRLQTRAPTAWPTPSSNTHHLDSCRLRCIVLGTVKPCIEVTLFQLSSLGCDWRSTLDGHRRGGGAREEQRGMSAKWDERLKSKASPVHAPWGTNGWVVWFRCGGSDLQLFDDPNVPDSVPASSEVRGILGNVHESRGKKRQKNLTSLCSSAVFAEMT